MVNETKIKMFSPHMVYLKVDSVYIRRTLMWLMKHNITSSTTTYYNLCLTNLKFSTAIFEGYSLLLNCSHMENKWSSVTI
jgi:hypothetical protein